MPSPYLSVVVTSRNDGHGGDPLARLQAFVNTFDAQCRRFGLDAELVVVEWNPPADRPRLHELVRRPSACSFAIRFIEVPQSLHLGLPNAHVLPLFQMIGKNVGIRRARGRFVLATNIDIIFSNELVEFFASGALRPGVLYRVDRHDIESDYPIEGSLDEQQAYCRRHHLRVHRSFGTFPVDPIGRLVPATPDVFEAPVKILDGWHVREGDPTQGYYRWAGDCAGLAIEGAGADASTGTAVMLDLEPNPYDPASWVELDIVADGRVLTHARLSDRQCLCVPFPRVSGDAEVVLRTTAASPIREGSLPAFERRQGLNYRLRSARLATVTAPLEQLKPYDMRLWRTAHRDAQVETRPDGIAVRSARARQTYCLRYGPFSPSRPGRFTFQVECSVLEGNISLHIVDEGADRWVVTEAFEMTAGERRRLFVDAELVPDRLYCLYVANRHRGSDGVSTFVVHSISGSAPWSDLEPHGVLQQVRLVTAKGVRRLARLVGDRPSSKAAATVAAELAGQAPGASPQGGSSQSLTARIEEYASRHRPASVHRNAAGDFQLMARENWFAVHGYAEFTMYSMNIDGLLGDVAHHAGVKEEVLEMPRCIYHLEHAEGSGWTPEGEGKLRKRLTDSGADWLDASTVDLWSAYMDWLKRPMLFNGPDWGFGNAVLRETTLPALVDHI